MRRIRELKIPTLVVLVLLSLTIVTIDSQGGMDDVSDGVSAISSPISNAFGAVIEPVQSWTNSITDYDELESENERLREELEKARRNEAEGVASQKKLERLEDELDISFGVPFEMIAARIERTQNTAGSFRRFINKGRNDGVLEGMSVVTAGGLVARVIDTTKRRATIELLSNPDLHVGIELPATGQYGVGHGGGTADLFVIDKSIDLSATVTEGELVTTSGLSGLSFPPGVPIGTVTSIRNNTSSLSRELDVEPFGDIDQLDYVQVITWLPGS